MKVDLKHATGIVVSPEVYETIDQVMKGNKVEIVTYGPEGKAVRTFFFKDKNELYQEIMDMEADIEHKYKEQIKFAENAVKNTRNKTISDTINIVNNLNEALEKKRLAEDKFKCVRKYYSLNWFQRLFSSPEKIMKEIS